MHVNMVLANRIIVFIKSGFTILIRTKKGNEISRGYRIQWLLTFESV